MVFNFSDRYLSRRIILNLEFHFANLRFCLTGISFSGFYLFRRIYVNKIIVNLGFNFVNLRFCLPQISFFWFLTSQTDICQQDHCIVNLEFHFVVWKLFKWAAAVTVWKGQCLFNKQFCPKTCLLATYRISF